MNTSSKNTGMTTETVTVIDSRTFQLKTLKWVNFQMARKLGETEIDMISQYL